MGLTLRPDLGHEITLLLHQAFSTTGIHGHTKMPEDILPLGVEKGSLDHVLFITLTISIDYLRDADMLWESSRKTYEDHQTRYLFNPGELYKTPHKQIIKDMQKHSLSKKPTKDANIWQIVGVTFFKNWDSDPRNFCADCDWYGPKILEHLKNDCHKYGMRERKDFPYLRGDKIGPLWLRMLRDNIEISNLHGLEKVPIPVDIHIARASLALGLLQGPYQGQISNIFELIRQVWAESVIGNEIQDRPMIALDMDEPLWHLSRYGCTMRNKASGDCPVYDECEASRYCIKGQIDITKNLLSLNT